MTGSIRSVRRASPAAALAVAALALALAVACGSDGGEEPAPATETPRPFAADSPLTLVDGGQGGVTVRVTWLTPELLASSEMGRGGVDLSRYLAFYVSLDTDAVDLARYDLGRISVLRDLDGGEYQPEAWLPRSVAKHHREGLLLFRKVELGAEGVELVIRGLAGVTERSYRWSEPPDG